MDRLIKEIQEADLEELKFFRHLVDLEIKRRFVEKMKEARAKKGS